MVSPQDRRNWIFTTLISRPGEDVPFDDVIEYIRTNGGGSTTDGTLSKDAQWISHNKGVSVSIIGRSFHVSNQLTIDTRKELNPRKKKTIADTACDILLGSSGTLDNVEERVPLHGHVKLLLSEFFRLYTRCIMLDAGSTNTFIAEALATRLASSSPVSLSVISNGLTILNALKRVTCCELIAIGGTVRGDYSSIGGELARRTLEIGLLRPHLSLIATTACTSRYEACCNSQGDFIVKSRMVEVSQIRCIVADSSKFESLVGGGWAFTRLSYPQVHFLLTDDDISSTVCDHLSAQGVGVVCNKKK